MFFWCNLLVRRDISGMSEKGGLFPLILEEILFV
jgi:hypothetical protein